MFISNKMFTANKNIAIIFWPNNSRFAKILIQFFVLYINVAISTILSVYLSIHLSIYLCFASFYLSTYLFLDHFLSKDKLAAFFCFINRKQVQPVLTSSCFEIVSRHWAIRWAKVEVVGDARSSRVSRTNSSTEMRPGILRAESFFCYDDDLFSMIICLPMFCIYFFFFT